MNSKKFCVALQKPEESINGMMITKNKDLLTVTLEELRIIWSLGFDSGRRYSTQYTIADDRIQIFSVDVGGISDRRLRRCIMDALVREAASGKQGESQNAENQG